MNLPIVHLLQPLLVSAIAGMAHVPAATAEDFNFDVPVDIDISPSDATRIDARVECLVSTTRSPEGAIGARSGEVVALGYQIVPIDPVSGSLHTVVILRMNATSRLRPASTGRFYTCFISYINYIFEEGVPAVALSISNMEEVYEGLTGLSFRRIVRQVSGEIAR